MLSGCDDARDAYRDAYRDAKALEREVRALEDAIADMRTPQPASGWLGRATVIDGDTLEIRGQRFRLHGVDAPESGQTCRRDGRTWRCGKQAAFELADRVARRNVLCEERDRDRYQRVVAVCSVDGEDLNAWLVRNGWALAYRSYSTEYVADEARARAARVGIHAGTFVPPWEYRKRQRRR